MPCEELKRLEAEVQKIWGAQRMLRQERRNLTSSDRNEFRLQLSKDEQQLSRDIEKHKQECEECKKG